MNDLIALSYLRIYHIFQYNFFCTEFYIIHQSDSGVSSAFQSIPNPANNNPHAKYSLIRPHQIPFSCQIAPEICIRKKIQELKEMVKELCVS